MHFFELLSTRKKAEKVMPPFYLAHVASQMLTGESCLPFPAIYLLTMAITCPSVGKHEEFWCDLCVAQAHISACRQLL